MRMRSAECETRSFQREGRGPKDSLVKLRIPHSAFRTLEDP